MAAADVTAIIRGTPRPMPQPPGAAQDAAAPTAAPGAPPGAPPVHGYPGQPGHPGQPALAGQPAAPPAAPGPARFPSSGPGWICLYPRCEGGGAEFDLPGRLRGPGDSYLAHIQAATGVAVSLEGRGSGAQPEGVEPLHLRLACQDAAKLEEGRRWVLARCARPRRSRPCLQTPPSRAQTPWTACLPSWPAGEQGRCVRSAARCALPCCARVSLRRRVQAPRLQACRHACGLSCGVGNTQAVLAQAGCKRVPTWPGCVPTGCFAASV